MKARYVTFSCLALLTEYFLFCGFFIISNPIICFFASACCTFLPWGCSLNMGLILYFRISDSWVCFSFQFSIGFHFFGLFATTGTSKSRVACHSAKHALPCRYRSTASNIFQIWNNTQNCYIPEEWYFPNKCLVYMFECRCVVFEWCDVWCLSGVMCGV